MFGAASSPRLTVSTQKLQGLYLRRGRLSLPLACFRGFYNVPL